VRILDWGGLLALSSLWCFWLGIRFALWRTRSEDDAPNSVKDSEMLRAKLDCALQSYYSTSRDVNCN
jgi:hypothetical protein